MPIHTSLTYTQKNQTLPQLFSILPHAHLMGKKFAFFSDTQIWHKVIGGFSVGSRINLLYNLVEGKNDLKVYPTVGTQYEF